MLLASCSGDGDETAVDTGGETESTVACDYPSDGGEPAKPVDAPADEAPDTGEATAVITTGAGDIDVTLDRAATPCTVNSFVSLAEQGYFDDTQCHRHHHRGHLRAPVRRPDGNGHGRPGLLLRRRAVR